jgi:hypothetical protein
MVMGNLKEGSVYIYERDGNKLYAREFGDDPCNRFLVGYDHNRTDNANDLFKQITEDRSWGDIRRSAKTNPALQEVLDRAIVVYELSKKNENNG